VLLAGFFFAPIPIVLAMPTDPKYFTPRELLVVPFGVLISVVGVEWLLAHRSRAARVVAAALIASVPLQFALFARDYFTRYQEWSAYRFDSMNFRQVVAEVIAADASQPIPALYVNNNLGEEKVVQCEFHLLARRRADVWTRTSYLAPDQSRSPAIAPASLLIVAARDRQLYDSARWSVVKVIDGPLGEPAAALLRRN